jgi:glycosyltransferase involved in cell wall biosynthesis
LIGRVFADFKPQAILTIAHGYSWLTAGSLARKLRTPLHLICHDDVTKTVRLCSPVRQWYNHQFEAVYRQSAAPLCVSPFMVEEYERRYGARGTVLYPSRAADCLVSDAPSERLREKRPKITCAFAGSINTLGYVRVIKVLAESLRVLGGRLLIFGPIRSEEAVKAGFDQPNIELRGLLSSNELIGRLRDEANLLFVPMSFDEDDKSNMEINFPSKLADFTAVGIPLLIWGPPYCSAVRWARENVDAAEVVDAMDISQLTKALDRLASDPERRFKLAARALELGNQFFSHPEALRKIYSALRPMIGSNCLV